MINYRKDLEDYNTTISKDKTYAENNTLLDNGYLIHEILNAGKLRCVEVCRCDRYGLTVLLFNIHSFINITNEKIVESNQLWNEIKKAKITPFNTYLYAKYYKINESIVHDLKMYCDQLIMMTFLYIEPKIVHKIDIDSIADYLYKNDGHAHMFAEHEDFLKLINNLDNSYKHSFSDVANPGRIGKNDNCIVNFYSENNKDIFNPNYFSVRLDDVISEFNSFFDSVELYIKEYKKC